MVCEFAFTVKKIMWAVQDILFFAKAKEIENARQQGKISFDKSKYLYNKLNQGNITCRTIRNNTDFGVNEDVNFLNLVRMKN